jgi:hypothetical protein
VVASTASCREASTTPATAAKVEHRANIAMRRLVNPRVATYAITKGGMNQITAPPPSPLRATVSAWLVRGGVVSDATDRTSDLLRCGHPRA